MSAPLFHSAGLIWEEPADRLLESRDRFASILAKWEGTRYMDGQRMAGFGTNCIGFGSAVLEEAYRMTKPVFERLPSDMAMHDREGAMSVMRRMMQHFPYVVSADGRVTFGDVIVTGESQGGPGHMIVVGCEPNQLWQATKSGGVRWTGMGLVHGSQQIVRIFNMQDKEAWA